MTYKIDAIDKKILDALQEDCSLAIGALGEKIGVSQAACWRRIHRLEEDGVIKKRVAIVDHNAIGCGTIIFAQVRLNAHGHANLEDFARKIDELPNVLECFAVLGDQDFHLKIAVKDIHHYEKFFYRSLSSLDGVAEIKSSVVMSHFKNETKMPVQEQP